MVRSARTTPEEEDTLREKILKSRIPVVVMDRKMDIPNVKSVTGIFCFNDMIALGVYTGCRAYHLRIPADLSVIGYDGIPFCETLDVPLSTVEQPVEEMGRAAATLLKQMMYQPQCAQDRLFLPSLQIRAGTASPADPSRR